MATQWQTFPIEFRGGLISNLSPLQQGSNAVGSATLLQNFESSKRVATLRLKALRSSALQLYLDLALYLRSK